MKRITPPSSWLSGLWALLLAATLISCTATPGRIDGASPVQAAAKAPADGPVRTIRILTIGNSFTRNATRFLDPIVAADGRVELVHGRAWIGGSSLARHYGHVEENLADPATGKPYGGKSLAEMLTAETWDIVTIQQLSVLSDQPETYHPAGDKLVAFIREKAPQAEIWLHQTWAYRADDTVKYADGYTQADMYNNLRAAYHGFAAGTGIADIIPTGDAFQMARRNPAWRFVYPDPNFDYENPTFPQIPDQAHSLNLGWFWRQRTKPVKFMLDTHHAGILGEYLGGCVWFERLTGLSVVGNRYVPEGISAEDAAFLQTIAHRTVADEANNRP